MTIRSCLFILKLSPSIVLIIGVKIYLAHPLESMLHNAVNAVFGQKYFDLFLKNQTCYRKTNYTKNVCLVSIFRNCNYIPWYKNHADQCNLIVSFNNYVTERSMVRTRARTEQRRAEQSRAKHARSMLTTALLS